MGSDIGLMTPTDGALYIAEMVSNAKILRII